MNSDVAQNFEEIGAFAAKITNGAVIKNCYANGEIVINFSDDEVDPVNEPDAIVFESEIAGVEIPALFTSDNPLGQGLILDLREYSGLIDNENNIYTQQNTTISGNIKSIKIIGSLEKRYRNLNFNIDTADDFKLTFVDFNATNSTFTINGEKNVPPLQ